MGEHPLYTVKFSFILNNGVYLITKPFRSESVKLKAVLDEKLRARIFSVTVRMFLSKVENWIASDALLRCQFSVTKPR